MVFLFGYFKDFLKALFIYFRGAELKFVVLLVPANVTAFFYDERVVRLFVFEVFVVKKTVGVGTSPCYITNL
jgi:hypothetical protein